MAENTENKQDNQKAQIKALESDAKLAFKEGRYDAVNDLATKIKGLDPESRFAVKILEKAQEAKADMLKKAKAGKISEYVDMIKKLYKEKNLENLKKLIKELRDYAPEEAKTADSWQVKLEKAENDAKRAANAEKIKNLEKSIKTAFNDAKFEDVEKLAEKMKEVDAENKTAIKFVSKIEEAKKEAVRKENAEKINRLQDTIKAAYKEANFDVLNKTAEELFKIDSENKFAKKYLAKAQEDRTEAKEFEAKAKMKSEKDVKAEGKESFFSKWFKKEEKVEIKKGVEAEIAPKKAEPVKSEAPAPVAPVVAPAKVEVLAPVTEAKAPAPVVPVKKIDINDAGKGNVFTKMFKKKEAEVEETQKSIIDTIVLKSSEKKEEKAVKIKQEKTEEKKNAVVFLGFARAFLQFTLAFMVLSAGFFYVTNIDENNRILALFGVEENYASRLHAASLQVQGKENGQKDLNKEISLYQEGYNTRYEDAINGIIENRLNWPDILEKINEITDVVYERNAISQYVKYTSFSFDAEGGTVSVNGSLSDPLGKNLQKLAELEEA
ncbi:hypothetical protein KKC59_00800, partial [bacterium]|nr:hypothetical protein [bacterium]